MLVQLANPLYIFGAIFSIVIAAFFFWRAAAIELYSNEEIFDVLGVGIFGGLLGGRLVAFLVDFEKFKFSFDRLIFFHIFPGFNFYGFVLGAFLAVAFLVKRRRQNPWKYFDLVSAPLILGFTFFFAFKALRMWALQNKPDYLALGNFAAFFVLLFIIRRLEVRKRHVGYFTCFYMVFVPAIDLVSFTIEKFGKNTSLSDLYPITLPLAFLVFGISIWYRFSSRVLLNDIKAAFAFCLLRVMAAIRVFRSLDEAGKLSKTLILVPYTIVRKFLVLLKGFAKELKLGIEQFLYALGLKHLK
ncbi:prolipoprotein diacylglyceryl transferase [Candidatus Curtissbacteria bacterium]|nr:prolipoprotein diacylglyceryl transferase [Candidatus Curtissbacteria bacterium]